MRVPPESSAITDLWSWRDTARSQTTDLVGFQVVAADGAIGNLDAATYDVGGSYIVVDTGFWIFGKRRMLPAGSSTGSTTMPVRSMSTSLRTKSTRPLTTTPNAKVRRPTVRTSGPTTAPTSIRNPGLDQDRQLDRRCLLARRHRSSAGVAGGDGVVPPQLGRPPDQFPVTGRCLRLDRAGTQQALRELKVTAWCEESELLHRPRASTCW